MKRAEEIFKRLMGQNATLAYLSTSVIEPVGGASGVAASIVEYAQEVKAALLAVGSRRLGSLSR